MKRVVLSGAAGFLGSALARRLLKRGHEVIGIDNFSTGRRSNVDDLLSSKSFSLVTHDIAEPLTIDGPVDQVLHLASPASPNDFVRLPIQIMKVGGLGTHNMLGLAKAKMARFLLASTSEVYGDPLVHPQPETYWGNVNPLGQRAVYDESKRYAEALTMAYRNQHQVNTAIARIFNTYGPGMRLDDGRVVSNFIVQALQGRPLTVHGTGSQTRCFCYVDDLIAGLCKLVESGHAGPINIGSDTEITVLELAQLVIDIVGSKSTISEVDLPEDDPTRRKPELSRADQFLDWRATTALQQGLELTVKYLDRELRLM